MSEAVWARGKEEPEYHLVTFQPGPNVHVAEAACGLVARFWPRIGVRMDDPYCETCVRTVNDE